MEGKHLFAITFQFHYGLRRNGSVSQHYLFAIQSQEGAAINKLASKATGLLRKTIGPTDYRQTDDKHEGVIMEMLMRLGGRLDLTQEP